MTLSAKELVKKAWNGKHTWKDDYTVKVGKINRNEAYEIVYQPSHEEFDNPYKLSIAKLQDDSTVQGEYLEHYNSLDAAMNVVEQLKKNSKQEEQKHV
ncbi:hypothetical protein [Paenibacillus sp. Mc5Re-14]|uniref:hypothetical protein n=1 Tax=Paenibacillus sp. Mc5Re-14 TaxID=1030529 RepID=UPI000A3DC77A|nr:hypothetical protein [Paenibacillus sp. Mc5Re-14]